MLIYVDDIIIIGHNATKISSFIDVLCSKFDSRRMGDLSFFLVLEINCTSTTISLCKTRYALDRFKKFHMESCKPSPTPLSSFTQLSSLYGDPLTDQSTYQSIVGGLQYLTISRPNIAYAINQVCQFMHAPRTTHLQSAKRILRYVKGTLSQGLLFHKESHFNLYGFSDSDWGVLMIIALPHVRASFWGILSGEGLGF